MAANRNTPMMRQYLGLKEKHPDAILLFRMGDFYEMFFEDAEIAADVLGLALTTRDKGKADAVPMAGFPWHAAESYIAKLVRRGHRVAVGEQLTDPALSKGIVERGVVEVVSPGTAVQDALIQENDNTYVAAVRPTENGMGFAAADITTGEILVEDLPREGWRDALTGLSIKEWLLPQDAEEAVLARDLNGALRVSRPGWWFDSARGERELREHLGVKTLAGFGCESLSHALGSAGAVLQYLREARGGEVRHLRRLRRLGVQDYMQLDAVTFRNLELAAPLNPGEADTTLVSVLDETRTAMGSRVLRAWLHRPLRDRARISERLDAVQELVDRPELLTALRTVLGGFRDVDRLLTKVVSNKATPRDVQTLGESLAAAADLAQALAPLRASRWSSIEVPDVAPLGHQVLDALVEEPPAVVGEGGVFRPGWDADLDALRDLASGGKAWIARLQEDERRRTGIAKLKVGYNRVFGYYLEVGKSHQQKVPDHYLRKQTLANAERYITPELKEQEDKILSAEEKLKAREAALFQELRETIAASVQPVQHLAQILGESDALASLAAVAGSRRFVRPTLVEEPVLRVRGGRHPVVEHLLDSGRFVPNDLDLNGENRQIGIITGPNMSGKSTYIRQAALMAIMAQMGSFVPAEEAEVGVFDRVFTRVGASDSIARGQSTFMVEMEETAVILNAATDRSLVLLDEVGRGTSTYDGLSLAWAVTEYLHESRRGRPLTLFATHYHELTRLAEVFPRIFNLNVQVKEWNDTVIFLHKIDEGAADRSYGIHVAELAGIPQGVLARARDLLERLEREHRAPVQEGQELQLTLFEPANDPLAAALAEIDVDALTPLDALNLLHAWKRRYDP